MIGKSLLVEADLRGADLSGGALVADPNGETIELGDDWQGAKLEGANLGEGWGCGPGSVGRCLPVLRGSGGAPAGR